MNTDNNLASEIAHILFLDIVAYSTLTMEQQSHAVSELQDVIRGSEEYQRAEAAGELACLPGGDSVAIVFTGHPLSAVRCSVEIAKGISAASIKLRMGVHTGPVTRQLNIIGKTDYSGSGINIAQRVMNCGDAGHILISGSAADVISEFNGWAGKLHGLGQTLAKHDRPIELFNLFDSTFGNPDIPSSIKAPVKKEQQTAESQPEQQVMLSFKVALLYRRNTQPDEQVLAMLEKRLSEVGCEVFIDRHLSVGVEWARAIEKQLHNADAVIPLISERSVGSEMLEYEIQTAHQAAQSSPEHKPRILPVRIAYTGPLPDGINKIMKNLNYALWEEPQDDDKLVGEIIKALQAPIERKPTISPDRLESVGGAVPLGSPFYIERRVDAEFKEAIARHDSIVLAKGARQMGKTSLLARGLDEARLAGSRVVLTDLQALGQSQLESDKSLFLALAYAVAGQLDLDISPKDHWDSDLDPNLNLEWFIRRRVMVAFPEPLVWGLDEVDRLFTCPFGGQVFGLFRSWHNKRALDPTGPWSRLTLAMAYATEAHLFITDLNQSPFNVGTRLTLDDFTVDQVAELNRRYDSPLSSPAEIMRVHQLFGGQPYLTRRALDEMASRNIDLDTIEEQAGSDRGLFGDHLRRILVTLSKDPEMTNVVRSMLHNGHPPTQDSFYRLRSAGLISGGSPDEAQFRCSVYRTYLLQHL